MNRRFSVIALVVLILALIVTGTLYSEDLKVTYVEGTLVARVGQSSRTLDTGDLFSSNVTLELSGNGYVELYYNRATITITEDGSYSAVNLISAGENSNNLRNTLYKIASFFKARPDYSVAAATRAFKPEDCNDQIYEGDFHLNNGLDRLAGENYDCAALHFLTGMNDPYTPADEQRECAFRLGTCYLAEKKNREAREYLTTFDQAPEPGDNAFGEYTVTVSALYIESQEYSKAVALLSRYLTTNPEGDIADAATHLMQLVS